MGRSLVSLVSRGPRAAGPLASVLFTLSALSAEEEPLFQEALRVEVPHISNDPSVRYDYDIVYVRALRAGDEVHKRFYTDFSQPVTMEPGADLMLLHPDGSEEFLAAGGEGAITDPMVSFDGEWVYYSYIYNLKNHSQWNPPRARSRSRPSRTAGRVRRIPRSSPMRPPRGWGSSPIPAGRRRTTSSRSTRPGR
jgi:hypothetical protein